MRKLFLFVALVSLFSVSSPSFASLSERLLGEGGGEQTYEVAKEVEKSEPLVKRLVENISALLLTIAITVPLASFVAAEEVRRKRDKGLTAEGEETINEKLAMLEWEEGLLESYLDMLEMHEYVLPQHAIDEVLKLKALELERLRLERLLSELKGGNGDVKLEV